METQRYHLAKISGNSKVGKIAVTMTSKSSCPDSCPMKAGACYAKSGILNLHWTRLTNGGGKDWVDFIEDIKTLPDGSKMRYNQSGDLPGINETIDGKKLRELSNLIKKKKLCAWSYSHKSISNGNNLKAIRAANNRGFTVNISSDNLAAADRARDLNLPTCVILKTGTPNVSYTPKGRKIVVCPNQTEKHKNLTCSQCLLCQKVNRNVIIGFLPHGNGKKKVNEIAGQ